MSIRRRAGLVPCNQWEERGVSEVGWQGVEGGAYPADTVVEAGGFVGG